MSTAGQKRKRKGGSWTHDEERGDGLVHPAVLLEEVPDDDAYAHYVPLLFQKFHRQHLH